VESGEPREFLVHARIDVATFETWVEAGWMLPPRDGSCICEVDLARAQFIRDLMDMGVNDEAIPVILDLVDQLHGVRRTLREVLAACAAPAQSSDQVSDHDAPEGGA
jgi:chaperone modulatory protein CbpM